MDTVNGTHLLSGQTEALIRQDGQLIQRLGKFYWLDQWELANATLADKLYYSSKLGWGCQTECRIDRKVNAVQTLCGNRHLDALCKNSKL